MIWEVVFKVRAKRISFSSLVMFFLLLPSFKPEGIENLSPAIEQFFDIGRVIALLIALLLYLYQGRFSKIILAIGVFQLTRLLSTLLNNTGDADVWGLLVSCGSVMTLCMVIEIGFYNNIKKLFKTMVLLLSILCTLNTITILLYPEGMYETIYTQNWLLGYDNVHILFILPLMYYYAQYARAKGTSRLIKALVLAFCALPVYITWSATSVVGCTLFLIIIILNEQNIRPQIMNCYTYVLLAIAFFLMVIIFRFQDVFKSLIEDVLHKELTFSGRTRIWDATLLMIAKKPILGNGHFDSSVNMLHILAAHAHNYYLQVTYEGGLIGLACFIVILAMACKRLYLARTSYAGFLLSGLLLCYLIMFEDEAYGNIVPFYGLIMCMYHVRMIDQGLPSRRFARKHSHQQAALHNSF